MIKLILPLLLVQCVLFFPLSAQKHYPVSNTQIQRDIATPAQSGPITVKISCVQKQKQLNEETNSWFEFSINHQVLKASDPIWVFDGHETRQMGNQGTEHVLTYRCVKEGFEGLQVHLYQQIFPNSTLVRERIKLSAMDGHTYHLTRENNSLWFHFPVYELTINASSAKEIRIATWGKEQIALDENKTYDDRAFDGGMEFNLAHCWMFHPDVLMHTLTADDIMIKGPFGILYTEDDEPFWMTAYEHASQDTRKGMEPVEMILQQGDFSVDAQQSVEGVFHFTKTDKDLHFIGIQVQQTGQYATVGHTLLRGGYLDGEAITPDKAYESVWSVSAYSKDEDPLALIKTYLQDQICEYPASRKSEFYYNTWGMQREYSSRGKDAWDVLTEERILQEIEYAAQLGVELFVLDDGWQEMYGVWKPHPQRMPNGLVPIKEALDKHGMKMGIWMNPSILSEKSDLYKQHPEWIILDSEGNPIKAQWHNPAVDLVGPYYDVILEDLKWLVDQGARFFKWDAINEYNSYMPGLHHGDESHSVEERIARYEYLLPIYVTRLMEEVVKYEPEVVIEIDLTEARRSIIGLAPLSFGKFFWMNNGASGYGDYSTYRAKSMRTIANIFEPYIPLNLFTYANYPNNGWPLFSQRYLINNSLLAGHGFWGNLDLLTDEQRNRIGRQVAKTKRVLPYLPGLPTEVKGNIGSTPEIYTQFNKEKGAGQVIAFSGSKLHYTHKVSVRPETIAGVLNHAYSIDNDSLIFDFEFSMPDDTREAFIIPSPNQSISIRSSSSWLDELSVEDNTLRYVSGGIGEQVIYWSNTLGTPKVLGGLNYQLEKKKDVHVITVINKEAFEEVVVMGE